MQTKQENELQIKNDIGTAGYARTVGEDGKSYRTGISALVSGAIGGDIEQLENDVEALQTTVGEHTADIQNNSDDISDLQTLTSGHTTSIGNLQTAVETNTGDINDLKEDFAEVNDGYYNYDIISNAYINVQTGNQESYNGWSASDFVPINALYLKVTCVRNLGYSVLYNASKEFIKHKPLYAGDNYVSQEEGAYIRFSGESANVTPTKVKQINVDPTLTLPYESADAKKVGEEVTDLKEGLGNTETFGATTGSAISTYNGLVSPGWNNYDASDFIPVYPSKKIRLLSVAVGSSIGVCFYDRNKIFISAYSGSTGVGIDIDATPPTNAYFIRVTVPTGTTPSVIYDDIYHIFKDSVSDLKEELENGVSSFGMQMFEKIGVIGDSISVGWAKDKNGNNSRRNTGISWPQQMARRLGCTAYNLGASGVDPVEWFQPDYEFAEYCYTQYQSVDECDLYIIGLGLNPTSSIGSVSDINQSDYTQNAETFYGQYARIIQMINSEHPNAIVICVTEPTTMATSYDEAVRNICDLNFIKAELVDLDADYRYLFTTPEIIAERQPDEVHYTPYGYSLIADAFMKALNDYISKNSANFKYVGVTTV